jgi:predicted DNA-binding antitoxin AbrB/MazE fold protein
MKIITAIFEDGMLKPTQPLDLPAHAEVRLTIEVLPSVPLTVGTLNDFLQNLPPLGDDAADFVQDIRAIRSEFAASPLRSGAELVAYWQAEGLIGARSEIQDSPAHARALRKQAQEGRVPDR